MCSCIIETSPILPRKSSVTFGSTLSARYESPSFESYLVKNKFQTCWDVSRKQSGAVEACWAHNPEVRGSKPRSANFFLSIFLITVTVPNELFLYFSLPSEMKAKCCNHIHERKTRFWLIGNKPINFR